jgi:hypothetical protein
VSQIKVEIDVSAEWYNTSEMYEEFSHFNISHELIELEGPGGGNPNIFIIGSEGDIRNWLESAGYDQDDIEYFIYGE